MNPARPEAAAAALVRDLALDPHPEGGWYREIWRSQGMVVSDGVIGSEPPRRRNWLTVIHYLLAAGERSRWHRVDSDEVWHFHAGDGLRLYDFDPRLNTIRRVRLGIPVPGGGATTPVPLHVIPAGHWQAAEPDGAFALVACDVAPGFDFSDFRLLDGADAVRSALATVAPDLLRLG
jgi:predicted cupin superfamily sugar epimerase